MGKATVAFILLTILPLYLPSLLPSELFRVIQVQGGINLRDLSNRVAVLGVSLAILVFLRGSVEKWSTGSFALSVTWKIFLLIVVIFILSLGKIENMGLAVLSSESSSASNTVMFDFRLIVVLTIVIVGLLIIREILEFKEINASIN